MIYDCFIFFNELDLLNLRLHELNDTVDYFVLVESHYTFTNQRKPLYFEQNKNMFHKFLPKIIHVIIDNFDQTEDIKNTQFYQQAKDTVDKNIDTWKREAQSRNAILNGLTQCQDNDIIIISDLDEIPNKNKIKQLKKFNVIKAFDQKNYYYFFNCQSDQSIYCSRAILKKNLTNPQEVRFSPHYQTIKNGGWHFSYLGGLNKIGQKISSFSHQELNNPYFTNKKRLLFNINNQLDIFDRPIKFKINSGLDHLPSYLQKHPKKFQKYFFKKAASKDTNTRRLIQEIQRLRQKIEENLFLSLKIEEKHLDQIISLKAEIILLKAKIISLKAENRHLCLRLEEIENSHFFKLWPLYNLIKKILKNEKKRS